MAIRYDKLLDYMVCTHIHFEKAEAAYCHHRLGHHTTVLHGAAAHCSRKYFSMLLSASFCISMNCTENVTDGYQTLLSNFTECLGMRVSLFERY